MALVSADRRPLVGLLPCSRDSTSASDAGPVPRRDDPRTGRDAATIGPVWDGNEVWLVMAGGATFAAFPAWYATMFSADDLALLAVLVFLIIRVISFEWRSKSTEPLSGGRYGSGRTRWGSFGASLIWGVGLANLLYGVPINSSGDFDGTFWDLFNGYTVLAGLAVVLLFAFHGATFLTLRTTGDLAANAPAGRREGCSIPRGRSSAPASSPGPSRRPSTATTRTSSRPCCPR